MNPAQLKERLNPRLAETTDELKEAVQVAAQPLEGSEEEKPDPKHEREYTFPFDWVDGRGKHWQGDFRNKILSIAEQQQSSILEAKLCGGLPYDAFNNTIRNVNHAVAHMVYSLQAFPDWARDLRKLDDPSVIFALFEEVASHEATFFGLT